jgi:hypothetical protein
MKTLNYAFIALLVAAGCSPFRSITSDMNSSDEILLTSGSLCTTWVDYEAAPSGSGANVSIRCLNSDGAWVAASHPKNPSTGVHYGDPSLAATAKGEVLALYHRDSLTNGFQIAVSRASANGWFPLSTLVNFDKGSFIPAYTQFGASLTEFQGKPFVFWTGLNSDGFLSRYEGSRWMHSQIKDGPTGQVLRHPEILNTGSDLYVFYGSPQPSVWRWNGAQLESLGAVTVGAKEITLYSSLAIWQGMPVIAYSSDDSSNHWPSNVSKVKVALKKNGTWSLLGEVQDVAGHDGVNPFVFTLGEDLYVLYGDYTTEGLPTDANQVRLRFRVKKWNGVSFVQIGGESPAVALSQRFEFSLVDDTIYFGAVVVPSSGPSSQVVLAWQNGIFSQVGGAIAAKPNGFWRARPGRVIATQGMDLSVLAKGKMLVAPTAKPAVSAMAAPLAVVPRFVDSAGFNYKPQSASPLIDAGAGCDKLVTTDADELTRPAGLRCDVGAYEYTGFSGL